MSDGSRVELKEYARRIVNEDPSVKVYIGCDSQNYSEKTTYATTVVFRYAHNGAHVIYHKENVKKVNDMWTRLWGELQRTIDVAGYLKFECGIEIEQIDLDYNSDPNFPSHKLLASAVGYAQSMGYNARSKPDLLMAVWAANLLCN